MVYMTLEKLAETGVEIAKIAEDKITLAKKAKYDKDDDFEQKRAEAFSAFKDLESFNKKALPVIATILGDNGQKELTREMRRLQNMIKML